MIQAEHLTMCYGPVVALDDVSFDVRPGEIVGLLGPNGAGKSTALKILTTYLHPTKGTAKVGGFDVIEEPLHVRRIIGYLPEILPLYMDMEVREYLYFVARARGLRGKQLRERIDAVLDACALRPMYRKIIRELSKGYKQRTGLAQALIHDPDIILLDEPTSGLDPHQILEVRHLIKELAKGKTVILSTHILQEVEATADRIVIINRGRIVGDGSLEDLRERAKTAERAQVTLQAPAEEAKRALANLNSVTRVELVGSHDGYNSFVLHARAGSEPWREAAELAHGHNWTLRELRDKPLSLEETFLALTKPAEQPAAVAAR